MSTGPKNAHGIKPCPHPIGIDHKRVARSLVERFPRLPAAAGAVEPVVLTVPGASLPLLQGSRDFAGAGEGLRALGPLQAARFRWRRTAAETVAAWEELLR